MKRVLPAAVVLLLCSVAGAETSNFDLSGKIYTKWLYRNNASMGTLSYGNPFWTENFSGDNGVGTEFELRFLFNVVQPPKSILLAVEEPARYSMRFNNESFSPKPTGWRWDPSLKLFDIRSQVQSGENILELSGNPPSPGRILPFPAVRRRC